MAKSAILLIVLETTSVRVLLADAEATGLSDEAVQIDEFANWLQAKNLAGKSHSCVVAVPAEDCLCASFLLPQDKKRGHVELTYMAEQYLPLAAENTVACFCIDGQSVWFAATAIDPLRKVLQILQSADMHVVSVTALPLLALATIRHAHDSTGVLLSSPPFGQDHLSWSQRRKLKSWVHTVADETAECVETEPNHVPDLMPGSPHCVNWDLATCLDGVRQICHGKVRPVVEFLTDPGLKEYRLFAGERQLQFWTGLVTACLVAVIATCLWKTGEYHARTTGLDSERSALLTESLPHIPSERRSILLARSHRNQLKKIVASAATLQRPPDPEAMFVQVLQSVATIDYLAVEEVRVADHVCTLSLLELPQTDAAGLVERLRQSGLQAVRTDKTTSGNGQSVVSWTITPIETGGRR